MFFTFLSISRSVALEYPYRILVEVLLINSVAVYMRSRFVGGASHIMLHMFAALLIAAGSFSIVTPARSEQTVLVRCESTAGHWIVEVGEYRSGIYFSPGTTWLGWH